jgi:hypothetical protein
MVVTWSTYSWTENGQPSKVYLQRYNRFGERVGGNLMVNDTINEPGGQSLVTVNASGASAVVWLHAFTGGWGGGYGRIYLQQFSANGERTGVTNLVDACGSVAGLSLAMNDAGYVVVAWTHGVSGYAKDTVCVRYYNPDGTPMDSKAVVAVAATTPEWPDPIVTPSVSMDDSGNTLVLWTASNYGRASPDIMGQRLLPFGVKKGGPFPVPMSEGPAGVFVFQRKTAVSLAARKILYVWEDNRRARGWDIYGKFSTFVWDPLVSVAEAQAARPGQIVLEQNYPNPFNPRTVIEYTVGGARGQGSGVSNVKLVIYDLLGREVAVLVDERKEPGSYEVQFDAKGLASGVYLYRLTAGSFVQTRKMLLVQ